MKTMRFLSLLLCLFNFCHIDGVMHPDISAEDRVYVDALDAQEAHRSQSSIKSLFDKLTEEREKQDSQRRHVIANSILGCAALIGIVGLAFECMQYECRYVSFKDAMQ